MPIAINGSGTLTGLSVGGLENGIITPAELSTGAPSWDAQYNLTNVASINSGPLAGFRNAIINGNFDIWQRGTSFTFVSGYAVDRFRSLNIGTTGNVTRQSFALGQTDVPGEPAYYVRTVVSSVAGAGNYSLFDQLIEDVRTFAGQQVTFSFWAKADATKNIGICLQQYFGTGTNSPSGLVIIAPTKVSIGTGWQKVTITATMPSLSGKTIGNDNNNAIAAQIWFDAGSNYSANTDTLGHQSGTFDIAQVQIEAGPVDTPFERRPIGTELALCQRYCCIAQAVTRFRAAVNTEIGETPIYFPVPMRALPTMTLAATGARNNVGSITVQVESARIARHILVASLANTDTYSLADAYLTTAEL